MWTICRSRESEVPALDTDAVSREVSWPLWGGAAAVVSSITLCSGGKTADLDASRSLAACIQQLHQAFYCMASNKYSAGGAFLWPRSIDAMPC